MTMTIIDDLDPPGLPTSQVEVIDFAIPEDRFHTYMAALCYPLAGATSARFPDCPIDGAMPEIISVSGRSWPVYELECPICGMDVSVE